MVSTMMLSWTTCKAIEVKFLIPSFRVVNATDYGRLETVIKRIIKEKQPFERLELSKDELKNVI